MNRRGAEPCKSRQMLADGIALVLRKAVSRIFRIQLTHEGVTRGLGQDRGGGDGQAPAVALHDGLLGRLKVSETARVEQLIKSAGAELRYLPPYSPDMNRSRRLFPS